MTNNNFSQVAAFIWSVADLLRGDFKQSQYGRVILPFTLLRRLECVLEPSKAAVLTANEKVKVMPLPEEAKEKMLLKVTGGLSFFNTSELSLASLGQKESVILNRVNDLFVTDNLTDKDMINYVHTVVDKMSENTRIEKQIRNNTREQAMLGEFDTALYDAVLDSHEANTEQTNQLLSDPAKMRQFAHIVYDVFLNKHYNV